MKDKSIKAKTLRESGTLYALWLAGIILWLPEIIVKKEKWCGFCTWYGHQAGAGGCPRAGIEIGLSIQKLISALGLQMSITTPAQSRV